MRWYSRKFNTAEGNSTFYGLPSESTFERWATQVPVGFAFCFKFPQAITHEAELDLRICRPALDVFLQRLSVLSRHGCLGPTFLQLSPQFSSLYRDRLETFLRALPSGLPWSVEVRHRDWFDEGADEAWFDSLLTELKIDRVLFDSRPLYRLPPSDDIEQESQRRKPRSPFRTTVTGDSPFVRLIGRNRFEEVEEYWDEWSKRIADWILAGLKPWIFTHAPDDAFAPQLVGELHTRVQSEIQSREPDFEFPSLPNLADIEAGQPKSNKDKHRNDTQLRLFE